MILFKECGSTIFVRGSSYVHRHYNRGISYFMFVRFPYLKTKKTNEDIEVTDLIRDGVVSENYYNSVVTYEEPDRRLVYLFRLR